ncbi:hypothetical protein FV113G1_22430 [Fusobacterium varium]|nr:hypothetical protein FV113G1_22430 [Fusobacterium varium]
MKVRRGKIILEIFYNIFLWAVFYLTTKDKDSERYAINLCLYYIPVFYQEGFIIYELLEQERETSKKNTIHYLLNCAGIFILFLQSIQVSCYLLVEKNEEMLYSLGIATFNYPINKETLLLIPLGIITILACSNCLEN